jgi:hypothetical protein
MTSQEPRLSVLRVLEYLHKEEQAALVRKDRLRLFALRTAWSLVWCANVWPGIPRHPRDPQTNYLPARIADTSLKQWQRERRARPLRLVKERREHHTTYQGARVHWYEDVLVCGHVVRQDPPWERGGKLPRRHWCRECGEAAMAAAVLTGATLPATMAEHHSAAAGGAA